MPYKTISYELVDEQAKRLESIAVLVRGITVSPKRTSVAAGSNDPPPDANAGYSFYGKVYFNAETGLLGPSVYADDDIWKSGDIAGAQNLIRRTLMAVAQVPPELVDFFDGIDPSMSHPDD